MTIWFCFNSKKKHEFSKQEICGLQFCFGHTLTRVRFPSKLSNFLSKRKKGGKKIIHLFSILNNLTPHCLQMHAEGYSDSLILSEYFDSMYQDHEELDDIKYWINKQECPFVTFIKHAESLEGYILSCICSGKLQEGKRTGGSIFITAIG